MELSQEGKGIREIARQVRASSGAVHRRLQDWKKHGGEALAAKPTPGRPKKLTAKRVNIKASIRPGRGRRGPAAGWRAPREPRGPQHRSPSQGSHQRRSCAGDRGAVKRRSSGAESHAETGTDY
ncbi:MAG: hypothetical protein HYR50_06175 [Candidatus Rokubacteria bacterium]|nr:hypothetical protein [Candidatus Rokubacteria bacterium]